MTMMITVSVFEIWWKDSIDCKILGVSGSDRPQIINRWDNSWYCPFEDIDSACRAEIDAVLDSIQPEDLFGEKITDRIADTFDRLMKKEFTEAEVKEMKSGLAKISCEIS